MTRIGATIIDVTRRELGTGVLQLWFTQGNAGRYARVKFGVGVRHVRDGHAVPAHRAPELSEDERLAMVFGLTVRQYRRAMGA